MSETVKESWPRTAETTASPAPAAGGDAGEEKRRYDGLEPTLNRFIVKYSWKQQLAPLILPPARNCGSGLKA